MTNDELKDLSERAKRSLNVYAEMSEVGPEDVIELLDFIDKIRAIHREEQARSADRLRAAIGGPALLCTCRQFCGDTDDEIGTCKGLPS